MSTQSVLNQMENRGYYLLPKSHAHSPGYAGLLVAIRKTPTKMHFDPEAIQLRLRSIDGTATWMTLTLKASVQESRHVCPGQVILRDRVDKRVHFFVFGGSLEIASGPDETVYSLRSPAPTLELTEHAESTPNQLASETEALIGEQRARWGSDETGFAERLAHMDPLPFYLSSLHSILVRYEGSRALHASFHDLYDALLREKEWLRGAGHWSATPPRLEDLLAPD